MSQTDDAYPISQRNRVRRRGQRGHYDHATVHAILDAAMLCHVAYVIDGQPYCTPTGFWREDDTLLWHGSSASRMLRAQSDGIPVCVTVTHMDAIVLARCGFNHSINYRSVMAYGRASLLTAEADKRRAMDAFVDRFFPGRTGALRPPSAQEVKATSFVRMPIEQASAKIRDEPPHDDEEDYAVPAWTALIPIRSVLGEARECDRQHPAADRMQGGMAAWRAGRATDEVFAETARSYHPDDAAAAPLDVGE